MEKWATISVAVATDLFPCNEEPNEGLMENGDQTVIVTVITEDKSHFCLVDDF